MALRGEIFKEYHQDDNGLIHRTDGPAIVYHDGDYIYYRHGMVHREDGPAIKMGGLYRWFFDGTELKQETYDWMKTCGINRNTENEADVILIKLKIGLA